MTWTDRVIEVTRVPCPATVCGTMPIGISGHGPRARLSNGSLQAGRHRHAAAGLPHGAAGRAMDACHRAAWPVAYHQPGLGLRRGAPVAPGGGRLEDMRDLEEGAFPEGPAAELDGKRQAYIPKTHADGNGRVPRQVPWNRETRHLEPVPKGNAPNWRSLADRGRGQDDVDLSHDGCQLR